MSIIVPAYYYAQQGADYSLDYPAEGFGGWTKTQVPLDPKRTAVVVMHVWQLPAMEECPGLYDHLEYAARADAIVTERYPSFLEAVRESGVRTIHVGAGFEPQLQEFPGYHAVREKYPPIKTEKIEASEAHKANMDRHWKNTCSADPEAYADIERSFTGRGFAVRPLDHEEVVTHSNQLLALCREHGIEHLIYAGFAVNMCLIMSSCGLVDMSRHGLMCSVVGDLTTAVENKASITQQSNREYGLWMFALQSGYVFLSEDLKRAFEETYSTAL